MCRILLSKWDFQLQLLIMCPEKLLLWLSAERLRLVFCWIPAIVIVALTYILS